MWIWIKDKMLLKVLLVLVPIVVAGRLLLFTNALKCYTCKEGPGGKCRDFGEPEFGDVEDCGINVEYCEMNWHWDSSVPAGSGLKEHNQYFVRRCDQWRMGRHAASLCVDGTTMTPEGLHGDQRCFCRVDYCNACKNYTDCEGLVEGAHHDHEELFGHGRRQRADLSPIFACLVFLCSEIWIWTWF